MQYLDFEPERKQRSIDRTFEEWLDLIEGQNAEAVKRFLDDKGNARRINTAPGSREAHHAWEGGYREHIRQTMMLVARDFNLMTEVGLIETLPEEERFTLSDALTVMFLHDIEKPFMYEMQPDGSVRKLLGMTKAERKDFRDGVIASFGFNITPTMENALKFVEGVRDEDYIPGERADQPLAALCHSADNLSARAFYDFSG